RLQFEKALQKQCAGDLGPRLDLSREIIASAHTRTAMVATAWAGSGCRTWLGRQQTFALHLLARELAGPADRFRLFPRLFFRWFLVVTAKLHLAENPLALHLLLQRLEGLVNVVIANENLHACSFVVSPTG